MAPSSQLACLPSRPERAAPHAPPCLRLSLPGAPPTRCPQLVVLPSGLTPLLGSSWENSPHGAPQPWAQTVSLPDGDAALLASVSPGLAVTPGQLS